MRRDDVSGIDVLENELSRGGGALLRVLLIDHTTGKNIRWATEDYAALGEGYAPEREITAASITGAHGRVIQPRVLKDAAAKVQRTKGQAEVFTPAWLCNQQNNLVDDAYFGRENVFNFPSRNGKNWRTNYAPILFPDRRAWQTYVLAPRLEMSCGEAPYLVSRYDVSTGRPIPFLRRIGLLDRKLRVIDERTDSPRTWFLWVRRAFESVYGFDLAGDNVLLARENLLATFLDAYQEKFIGQPTRRQLLSIARVVAWNIWQMDGLDGTTPYSTRLAIEQGALFDGGGDAETPVIEREPSRIYDWREKRELVFRDLMKGGFAHGTGGV